MTDLFISFFQEFRHSFRIADVVDILLVAVVLYWVLTWFKEAGSRRMLTGLVLLLIVYFAARALDMYLTSLLFHTGFAVLLILLVVVFQEDLRRMFEHVATWGSLQPLRQARAARIDVNALIDAVFTMAASKTGALLVLKGSEPLDRHTSGGVVLRGHFSKTLIYSLFDSSSPGHDGAVIIVNDRVQKFGVHLPISKNHTEIGGRGTRHSAALGLSENCDALAIVVSEERGSVSVAEGGRLKVVVSSSELKERLDAFLASRFPEATRESWQRFVFRHWRLKILAIGMAVVAWFVLAYNPSTIQRTFAVPIEYRNLAKNLVLDDSAPHEARVTLSGSERNFRFLEPATLRISIDLSDAQGGPYVTGITDRNIRLPVSLELYRIEPRIIRLYLQRQASPEKSTHVQEKRSSQEAAASPAPANQAGDVTGNGAHRPPLPEAGVAVDRLR